MELNPLKTSGAEPTAPAKRVAKKILTWPLKGACCSCCSGQCLVIAALLLLIIFIIALIQKILPFNIF